MWLSELSLVVIVQIGLVADDIGTTILVNGDPVGWHLLFHPVNRELPLGNCFLPRGQFTLQLLNFITLNFDLRIKTFSVESSSGLFAKLLVHFNLCSTSLWTRLEDVYSSTIVSYKIDLVCDFISSWYLLLIIVDASKALAIAGSRSIIRSWLAATLSLRSRIFSATHIRKASPIIV